MELLQSVTHDAVGYILRQRTDFRKVKWGSAVHVGDQRHPL